MLSMATVLVNEVSGAPEEGLRRMVLSGVSGARPGQFLHIQVSSHLEPLLRRPISIAGIDRQRHEVTLFYRIQGRGTQLLAEVRPGEKVSVLGPLGQGFCLPSHLPSQAGAALPNENRGPAGTEGLSTKGELWLVAGGIGVFPLLSLAQEAVAQRVPVRLFWGGTSKRFLESAGLSYWQNLGIPLHLTTLDGSLGRQGMVTGELDDYIAKHRNIGLAIHAEQYQKTVWEERLPDAVQVATCGPKGMLQAVAERILPLGIPLEVSLEERMGCGVGACLGCVVNVRGENGSLKHKKVCHDGPVFRGEEVVWDA